MPHINAYIAGQAQLSFHEVDAVDHPFELMKSIANQALADAGLDAAVVDAIACVDPFSWTYADLAPRLAADIGCRTDVAEIWLPSGGTTPQDLLHQINAAMQEGDLDVALLVGAEAMRTRRKASRRGEELPWPARDTSIDPMRGQKPFSSAWEARHGLRLPIQCFPIHENAIRARHGRSQAEQIDVASRLLHKNALVAADNPNAWFRDAPSAALIGTVTDENRMIAYPYTKRMNAIMDVDQAAALVIVSSRYLERLQRPDQAIAILGGAGAEEVWNPLERADLSRTVAMQVAFESALASAGVSAGEMHAFDFYSCFPSPIQMALDALGLSLDDPRAFSITGGLAYAGGPGNNYVSHSLATAVARLRARPHERLMITGIGMANTKHTATILSHAAHIPAHASGRTIHRVATGAQALPVIEKAVGRCRIVSYTVEYDRDALPVNVIYLLNTRTGERAIANARDPAEAADALMNREPIGREGNLEWDATAERQYFVMDLN